jgi:hypothetical protein
MLDQYLHRRWMSLLGRPHQRRGPAQFFFGVDAGLMRKQNLDCIHISISCGEHQRRLALRTTLVRVRAGLQQLLDHACAAVHRRQMQRSGAFAIGRFHVRAGGDERVGHGQVVFVGRPLDRRRPIGLRSIHVRLLLQ